MPVTLQRLFVDSSTGVNLLTHVGEISL